MSFSAKEIDFNKQLQFLSILEKIILFMVKRQEIRQKKYEKNFKMEFRQYCIKTHKNKKRTSHILNYRATVLIKK